MLLGPSGAPNITVNNYGGAQNLNTGNATLQQLTGNPHSTINSVIHPQDIVGTVSGGNPATPTYSTTSAATGVTTVVMARDSGQGAVANILNIFSGTTTPHNCYGTAIEPGCGDFWASVPRSTALAIVPITTPAPPTVSLIQITPPPDWLRSYQLQHQVQTQSNSQMNNLLQRPAAVMPNVSIQPSNNSLNRK